jgi:hypothetical protein
MTLGHERFQRAQIFFVWNAARVEQGAVEIDGAQLELRRPRHEAG